MMRKIKVIKSWISATDDAVQEWLKTQENIFIVSVSGAIREDGDALTWILYEEDNNPLPDLLKS